jgi:hypothetical protein
MAPAAPLRLTTERRNRGTRACAGQAELPWSVGLACGPGHHRASKIAHTRTPHTSAPVSYPGTGARAGHSARSARRIKRDRHSRRIGNCSDISRLWRSSGFTGRSKSTAAPKRSPPLRQEPPITGWLSVWPSKSERDDTAVFRLDSTLLTCTGYRQNKDVRFRQVAGLQALKAHFRRSQHAFELRKRGAKGTRTPGLLHAIQTRTVAGCGHVSPCVPFTCSDSGWVWPSVALCLAPLAPNLAPRNPVSAANVRINRTAMASCGGWHPKTSLARKARAAASSTR